MYCAPWACQRRHRGIADAKGHQRLPVRITDQLREGAREGRLESKLTFPIGALGGLVKRLHGEPLDRCPQVGTLPEAPAVEALGVVRKVMYDEQAEVRDNP